MEREPRRVGSFVERAVPAPSETKGCISLYFHAPGPVIRRQTGLLFEFGHEFTSLRYFLPYRRQQRSAVPPMAQHQAVNTGAQLFDKFAFRVKLHRFRLAQDRDLDAQANEFGFSD